MEVYIRLYIYAYNRYDMMIERVYNRYEMMRERERQRGTCDLNIGSMETAWMRRVWG